MSQNQEACKELGKILYTRFVEVSVVNGASVESFTSWNKLPQDQKHVWERTALSFAQITTTSKHDHYQLHKGH